MRLSILLALFGIGGISTTYGDDAPSTIADQLSQITRKADSVTVEYISGGQPAEYSFDDKEWILRLAAILEKTIYDKREHCWCISFPRIRLNAKDEVILRLSIHHGEKLRANGGNVSGDLFIGKEAGSTIATLINEKKKS